MLVSNWWPHDQNPYLCDGPVWVPLTSPTDRITGKALAWEPGDLAFSPGSCPLWSMKVMWSRVEDMEKLLMRWHLRQLLGVGKILEVG